MPTFQDYILNAEKEINELAANKFAGIAEEVVLLGNTFIQKTRSDLELWTTLLRAGKLSSSGFEWLLATKMDVLGLSGLASDKALEIQTHAFKHALFMIMMNGAKGFVQQL